MVHVFLPLLLDLLFLAVIEWWWKGHCVPYEQFRPLMNITQRHIVDHAYLCSLVQVNMARKPFFQNQKEISYDLQFVTIEILMIIKTSTNIIDVILHLKSRSVVMPIHLLFHIWPNSFVTSCLRSDWVLNYYQYRVMLILIIMNSFKDRKAKVFVSMTK